MRDWVKFDVTRMGGPWQHIYLQLDSSRSFLVSDTVHANPAGHPMDNEM